MRARQVAFFGQALINAEISEMVSHCPACIKYQQVQNKQPLKVHDVPTDHGTK